MHGQKKRRKRSIRGEAEIDGHSLNWELVSEPQWTSDGCKGLCVSVRQAQGASRELVIEFPYDRSAFLPQRPTLTGAIVEAEIRAALDDGWNPSSRGQTYVFMSPTKLELRQNRAGQLKTLVN